MTGPDMPASTSTAVNDYAPGIPQSGEAGSRTRRRGARLRLPDLPLDVPGWLMRLAMAAMTFMAFFSMTNFGWQLRPEHGGYMLLVALLMAGMRPWRELAAQPAAQAVLVFSGFLVLQAAYVTWVEPADPAWGFPEQLTTASKLVRLGAFSCFLGWWLSLVPRAIPYLFVLMVLGLLSSVLIFMPWTDLAAVIDGQLRPSFRIPENLAGQLAAVAGWLAVCMMAALWFRRPTRERRATLIAGFLVAYLGCLCALLISQSRGAWLAFAVTLPIVAVGLWWMRGGRGFSTKAWPPLLMVVVTTAVLLFGGRDILSVRLSTATRLLDVESTTVPAVDAPAQAKQASLVPAPSPAAGKVVGAPSAPPAEQAIASTANEAIQAPVKPVAQVAPTPPGLAQSDVVAIKAVSVRMQLYELGMEKWHERPWLGWGMRTTHTLIEKARFDTGVPHVHLHNAYLDTLVGIGLVGATLLMLVFALLMRELVLAWRAGLLTTATLWVFGGCFGIVLVANAFDSLLWRFEYSRAPLEILFGCCIAYGLIRRRATAKS